MNENIMNENIERVAQALKNAGFDYKEALEGLEVLTDLHIELECLNSSNYREYKCFDDLGNQYSWGETLIDKVNKINKKYNIVDKELKNPQVPEVDLDDEDNVLAEYFKIEYDPSEGFKEGQFSEVCDNVDDLWRNCIEDESRKIRDFFDEINEKYETEF